MPKPSSPQWEKRDSILIDDMIDEIRKLYRNEWPNTADGRAMMIAFEQRAIAYAYRLANYIEVVYGY